MAFEIENGVLIKYIEDDWLTEEIIPADSRRNSTGMTITWGDTGRLEIPAGVTSIGSEAFCGCSRITSLYIPEGVTSIGEAAFDRCERLAAVTIPEGVTSIGKYAFCDCRSLTGIELPSSITEIGKGAFLACTSLTSVTLPAHVVTIESDAFTGCYSLSEITLYGITFYLESLGDDDLKNAMEMLRSRDFSIQLNKHVKYVAAVGFWMQTADKAAEVYIGENISLILRFFILNNNPEVIRRLLETGRFITEHIDKLIELAILNVQNGGSVEIQRMLLHYKADVIGYNDPADQFKL